MTPRHRRPVPARPAPPRSGARQWLLLGGLVAIGTLLRVWILLHTSGMTMDSPLYIEMASRLGRIGPPLGPAHHGYPALVSLAGFGIVDRELAARVVSMIAGIALIVVTYAIARRQLPTWGAPAAAALVALHPLLALSSASIMTESSFQALLYVGMLMLDSGWIVSAGAVLGLAYAVRPEAMVVAVAGSLAPSTWRRRGLYAIAFVLCMIPEVALLSAERGHLTLTPKTNLVEAAGAATDDAEWLAAAPDSAVGSQSSGDRIAAVAARYPDRLMGQLERVHQTWPAPLAALSVVGAIARPGPLLAPLVILPVLPLLGVTPHLRYPQTLVPALAVYAAIGAAWCVGRARSARMRRAVGVTVALAGVAGMAWCWRGPSGDAVRRFEDAPIPTLRKAGRWLAVNGRPDALVMDRKPYLPYFAQMRHALMPNDDYDTIVEYARRTGVDYLVIEEYVMLGMRPQFVPLMTDTVFREREQRLRMIYGADDGPRTGVGIFEVLPAR
jgi:hypothetical protein